MAWNEPGGSGGKDPWGGRGSEQGPPDLDEMMRRFQDRVARLFGRRRGMDGGNGGTTAVFVVGIIAVVWALSGIYTVNDGSCGVVQEFGAYKETTTAGAHWYPRFIQSVTVVPLGSVTTIDLGTRTGEGLMVTQDENLVEVRFGLQYKIKDARQFLFSVDDPERTLRDAADSAMREVVGQSPVDAVMVSGGGDLGARAQQIAQASLDHYQTGLEITRINVQSTLAPEKVQSAFTDASKASEEADRLKAEANAYAGDVLPKARGEAARITADAEAYKTKVIAEAEGETARFLKVLDEYQKAPGVTRERMYIEALESVLTHSSKVMVDTRHNDVIYLPLEKMTQREPAEAASAPAAAPAPAAPAPASAAAPAAAPSAQDLRSRDNARRREVR